MSVELSSAPADAAPGRDLGRRIRGADAGFLYIESETQTSTCVDAVVIDPDPSRAPLTFERLREHVAARLDRVPHLRRRLHMVPGGIGHAVWADDETFDLDDHLGHRSLTVDERAVGDAEAQLDAVIVEFTPTRLPIDRPLWHVTLVDGFADGSQVVVLRVHHTYGDGAALVGVLTELFDDSALERPPVATAAELRRQRPPSRVWLFLRTLVRQVFVWLTLPVLLFRTIRRFKAVRRRRDSAPVAVPDMSNHAPRTVLNACADNERATARAVFALDDLRAVRAAAGTTLSDVVVAVVAGGLRTHLLRRDALPDVPLVVNVPLGDDAPGTRRLRGNVFVNYYAMLPTDVADPRERLARTAEYTAEAKHQLEIQGRNTLTSWLDRIPPALAWKVARGLGEKHREGAVEPDFNVLVSNVRIPAARWRLAGHPVRTVFMTGPVTDGYGLNITVAGYADHVTAALHVNPGAVPGVRQLADDLSEALDELVRLYVSERPEAAGPGAASPESSSSESSSDTNSEVA